ncbi:hypothetical protein Y032_0250g155 [Ancylostoma ceylanicum]|uniref:Uncharacterized protein n=1 Tax=Ancylostoma ceylanicum TaxID=53326 RepID=A0A016SD07_9BILA|nr:hypothetical protein Y032_0250g155 [Ancylostoma ceylanicum]
MALVWRWWCDALSAGYALLRHRHSHISSRISFVCELLVNCRHVALSRAIVEALQQRPPISRPPTAAVCRIHEDLTSDSGARSDEDDREPLCAVNKNRKKKSWIKLKMTTCRVVLKPSLVFSYDDP